MAESTLQGMITYPTKREVRKIIFKFTLGGDMLVLRRVFCVFFLGWKKKRHPGNVFFEIYMEI